MIACKSYIKIEDNPENKGIYIYGFKHIKTDEIDIVILIGPESDVINVNVKLLNFWSNKFLNEELKNRYFKTTGWSFMTIVKRNNFFQNSKHICL